MPISLFTRPVVRRFAPVLRQCHSRHQHGYVVLVPEIGEDLPSTDPHLRPDGLPQFSAATIEKCIATIGKQALEVERTVQLAEQLLGGGEQPAAVVASATAAAAAPDLFADILRPIEESEAQLEITWGLAKCLYLGNSSRMPTKSYRQINERARKARYNKFNSPLLYAAVRDRLRLADDAAAAQPLSAEQRRLLQKFEREGRLNGVALPAADDRAVLWQTTAKLRDRCAQFAANVDTAVRQFGHTISDYRVVRDFPADVLQLMAPDAALPAEGPWTVGLQPALYGRFLEHCPDRTLRWNVWQAQTRKCSGYTDKALSNSVHLEEIRGLRRRQAQLLGYGSFAEMSMETKWAAGVDEVRGVLEGLREAARPAQERELQELNAFAQSAGGDHPPGAPLDHCDIPYWRRKWLRSVHHYDADAIREYFPLPRVLDGTLTLLSSLLGVRFAARESPSTLGWHPDVQFYDIFDASSSASASPIAGFYLDLYARDADKLRQRQGNVVAVRTAPAGSRNVPLAALIFDFPVPLYGKPSLLSYADVQALLGRLGSGLQHLLTGVQHSDVAGMANIEWDAVGVAAQTVAGLVRSPAVLARLSGHFASGEPMPAELRGALAASHRGMAGLALSQELYTAALDLELHSKQDFWLEVVRGLWPQYQALPLDKRDAHPCSLVDVVAGGWSAAYYGHLWSRLVAADVLEAFAEAEAAVEGSDEAVQVVGARFRKTFLALGGARHAGEVFRQFRGREPSTEALLRALGLDAAGQRGGAERTVPAAEGEQATSTTTTPPTVTV